MIDVIKKNDINIFDMVFMIDGKVINIYRWVLIDDY
jgi:hypothetical protein